MMTSIKLSKSPKVALEDVNWLSPTDSLEHVSGKDFGRTIEVSAKRLQNEGRPCVVNVRKRPSMVVMPVEEYQQLIELKHYYEAMLHERESSQLDMLGGEFDQLFARITSCESRAASDDLFDLSERDLAETFQPGKTEGNQD